MPILTIDKQYQDGVILTEAQLDAAFDSVSTLLNVTGLGSDNIQDGSIGPNELATSAVSNTKLATNSVSTAKIQDNAITQAKLATAVQNLLVPAGTVSSYAGDTAPTGWLICDGTQVSRTTYADLFAIVGVRFGSGDGTTTFHLPDLRGRVIRMVDGAANRDPDSGARTAMNTGGATGNNIGSVQLDQVGPHTHPATITGNAGAGGIVGPNGNDGGGTPWSVTNKVFVNSNGTTETRMKNAYMNMIIKF